MRLQTRLDEHGVLHLGYDPNDPDYQRDDTVLAVLTHHHGLEVFFGDRHNLVARVIPGEFPLRKVVAFLCKATHVNLLRPEQYGEQRFASLDEYIDAARRAREHEITRALLQSGIWQKRGAFDSEHAVPKNFWRAIHISAFTEQPLGTTVKEWWKNYLAELSTNRYASLNVEERIERRFQIDQEKHRIWGGYSRHLIDRAIDAKIFPEVPWSVRKYNRVPFKTLMRHVQSGLVRSPLWGQYVTSGATAFDDMLHGHGLFTGYAAQGTPQAFLRDRVVRMLVAWPKGKNAVDAFNSACNAGIPIAAIALFDPKSPGELRRITEIWRQIKASRSDRPTINHTYTPPKVTPPEGWQWADHRTFYDLSDLYNCCISNNDFYGSAICNGTAHAIYKPDTRGGGSLAFISWDEHDENWYVHEQHAHSNGPVAKRDADAMKIFTRTLTTLAPGPSPRIKQIPPEQVKAQFIARDARSQQIFDLFEDAERDREHYMGRAGDDFFFGRALRRIREQVNNGDHQRQQAREEFLRRQESSMEKLLEQAGWTLDEDFNWVQTAKSNEHADLNDDLIAEMAQIGTRSTRLAELEMPF